MSVAARKKRMVAGPGPARAAARPEKNEAMIALVDDLATLAASLWLDGKFDTLPTEDESDAQGE